MTGRERLRRALSHREPDRVPVDLGSTGVTGIHVLAVARLRDRYGLGREPVKVVEPYQMLGQVDESLAEILGLDTAGMGGRNTLFGFPNTGWKEWRTPWGQDVLVPEGFITSKDTEGHILIHPQGDVSAPPSGRMPRSGYFFDAEIRQPPIDDSHLDPEDNLEEFTPFSTEDMDHWRAETDRLRRLDSGIVASFGGMGLGDIALVPGLALKEPRGIRDVTEWYVSTLTRQDYIHRIFQRQTDIAIQNLERIRPLAADVVDVVFVCGTDFGTQSGQFCSPETFDSLYAPYYRIINGWIHSHTSWKTLKHSCGAVEPLIGRFIDCGFDILNPVQTGAAGMDPAHLKSTYGDGLVFWGGGVDTQKTLPFGTPEEVETEVLRHCEIFAPGGGFVFNPIHNIQANVPVENTAAIFSALRRFAGLDSPGT
jgi:hypothetical protein